MHPLDQAAPRARRAATILAAILHFLLLAPLAVHADAEGKQAFLDARCDRCHGVEAAGIEASKPRADDLSHAGATRDAEWIRGYLLRKVMLDDRPHPVAFKDDGDALETLVAWLAGLE